eukprot:36799-Eustigmatos_ZCMA.PRE.1
MEAARFEIDSYCFAPNGDARSLVQMRGSNIFVCPWRCYHPRRRRRTTEWRSSTLANFGSPIQLSLSRIFNLYVMKAPRSRLPVGSSSDRGCISHVWRSKVIGQLSGALRYPASKP